MGKIRVLIFVGYYLPGYMAGGVLRTVANLVEHLGDEFDFKIVTRNCDLGDDCPYVGIKPMEWTRVGKADVLYVEKKDISIGFFRRVICGSDHDVVYVNSFFDHVFTIKLLLVRLFIKNKFGRTILAPRGEFSAGALRLKWFKKSAYIYLSKLFGFYSGVTFQASSEHEKQDISRALNIPPEEIMVAIDLPGVGAFGGSKDIRIGRQGSEAEVRVVFLSRISPKKNLDYALRVISKVSHPIRFDIYGPLEDLVYWEECRSIIDQAPKNVIINYCGSVLFEDVKSVFAKYDLFLFPTRGENYGHVIAESLSVGTPVLISDQTPWKNLSEDGLGWELPLGDPEAYIKRIMCFSETKSELRELQRETVIENCLSRLCHPDALQASHRLLSSCK